MYMYLFGRTEEKSDTALDSQYSAGTRAEHLANISQEGCHHAKLFGENLRNLWSSIRINRIIKSRRMGLTIHVELMVDMRTV
jgi:hypothetical protein